MVSRATCSDERRASPRNDGELGDPRDGSDNLVRDNEIFRAQDDFCG